MACFPQVFRWMLVLVDSYLTFLSKETNLESFSKINVVIRSKFTTFFWHCWLSLMSYFLLFPFYWINFKSRNHMDGWVFLRQNRYRARFYFSYTPCFYMGCAINYYWIYFKSSECVNSVVCTECLKCFHLIQWLCLFKDKI